MGASKSAEGWPVWSFETISRPVGQIDRLAVGGNKGEFGLVLDGVDGEERNALEVGAVVARRLKAVQSELRGDVLGGQLAAPRAGTAAFEQIEREKAHMGANLFRVDGAAAARARRGRPGMSGTGVAAGCWAWASGCGEKRRRQTRTIACIAWDLPEAGARLASRWLKRRQAKNLSEYVHPLMAGQCRTGGAGKRRARGRAPCAPAR